MRSRRRALRASIIGAGQVGTALALLLHRHGFRIVSVVSRKRSDARRCARLVHCSRYSTQVADLSPATALLVIAVPDEEIQAVARATSLHPSLDFIRLTAFHTSGCLTSDELKHLRRKGTLTFSLHPIQTFPPAFSPIRQLERMKGVSYGIEGPPDALSFARDLIRSLGGRALAVPKKEKISYHLACVLASNYPVVLVGAVEEAVARFSPSPHLRHFRKLIETSVANALTQTPRRALTGPIARGSTMIVAAHVRNLRNRALLRGLYGALGRYAVELSRRAGILSRKQARALARVLKST